MDIDEFEWDDANVVKVGLRGYEPDQIDDLLDNRFIVIRNKRGRAGSHRVVGRLRDGRLTTVVIVAAGTPGMWRPVTAWPADAEEIAHANRSRI